MKESTKTLLLVGGLAVGAYLAYKYFTNPLRGKPTATAAPGLGQSTSAATNQGQSGSVNWWQNIGAVGQNLNGDINSIDNTLNSVYGMFGSGGNNNAGDQPTTGSGG